jgi:alpha-L-fucosidase
MDMLQHGDPGGTVWRPGETDVSIRPGWFYHPAEDDRVKSADRLVDLYFTSVGRNSKLLLNVPPTRAGLLHATDVARLAGMRRRLDTLLGEDLAAGRAASWLRTGGSTAVAEVDLGRFVEVSIADLREEIAHGQAVARYALEGMTRDGWRVLSRGTTIGYRKLDRLPGRSVRRVRLVVEDAIGPPEPVRIAVYS